MRHTLVLNSDASPISLLPLSAMTWQDSAKALYVGAVVPIHYYDDWTIHSPSVEMKVPSVVMTKDYVKFRKTVAFTKENLFLRDNFRCQYCWEYFHAYELTYDHVIPSSKGGKTNFGNIVSSCSACNHRRGDNESIRPRIKPVRPTYFQLVENRRKYPISVSDASWIPYIGWDHSLVTVSPPHLSLGWSTERLRRTFMKDDSF